MLALTNYIIQVKEMCKKLYAENTNIDYFPTNFVPQDGKLYWRWLVYFWSYC